MHKNECTRALLGIGMVWITWKIGNPRLAVPSQVEEHNLSEESRDDLVNRWNRNRRKARGGEEGRADDLLSRKLVRLIAVSGIESHLEAWDDSFGVMLFDLDLILTQFYNSNWVKNGSKSNCITPKESSLDSSKIAFLNRNCEFESWIVRALMQCKQSRT